MDVEKELRRFSAVFKEHAVLIRSMRKHTQMLQRELNQIRYTLGLLDVSAWTQSQKARVRYGHGEVSGAVENLWREHKDCRQSMWMAELDYLRLLKKHEPDRFKEYNYESNVQRAEIALGYRKPPKPKDGGSQ